ncbi:MAG: CocE/NonD family hydrolase, partial [Thermomicrobiales bacterium]|nr:CocE/NonD family hydrolase [Thermomicrobiales bacterium]
MRNTVEFSVTRDIPVEMRDGTILYTDVYKPAGEGRFPVILQRTPYNKEQGSLALIQTDTFRAVRHGYAVVIQDCRGRYASDGEFTPFHQEIDDGYDTVEWCAAQSWSDGNVGMVGTSYVGATQWLAAISAPPSLKCIVPCFTSSDYYEGWTYQGGAFQWGFMCNWIWPFFHAADLYRQNMRTPLPDYEEKRRALADAIDNMAGTVTTLPLAEFPIDHDLSGYLREWLAHPSRGPWWQAVSIEDRHEKVTVHAYNVVGWYDIFLYGKINNFTGLREKGANDA